MLRIKQIVPESIAQQIGIKSGDNIIAINGNKIHDYLDFLYYITDQNAEIIIKRNTSTIIFDIEKDYQEDVGFEFGEMEIRSCSNKCIFCFVYQNPKGLRRTLYVKDEDYRFSFLYGNYITLTNTGKADLRRIIKQRLSPLYISIHATDVDCRKKLLGIHHDDHIMENLDFLVKGGIELHMQIVVCPGINDGDILIKTIKDLIIFYPGVKSVAIVPVGLTKHRKNLFPLRLHTVEELENIINIANKLHEECRKKFGSGFVYLTDEFFLKTNKPVPAKYYYDDFYQIENGVGMVHTLLEQFESEFAGLPGSIPHPFKITWITGTLAFVFMKKYIISRLKKINKLDLDLIAIPNSFFGHSVSVSGLLTGQDIFEYLKDKDLGDLVLLPPRILNDDNLFLDNWSLDKLETKLGVHCRVFSGSFRDLFKIIMKPRRTTKKRY